MHKCHYSYTVIHRNTSSHLLVITKIPGRPRDELGFLRALVLSTDVVKVRDRGGSQGDQRYEDFLRIRTLSLLIIFINECNKYDINTILYVCNIKSVIIMTMKQKYTRKYILIVVKHLRGRGTLHTSGYDDPE